MIFNNNILMKIQQEDIVNGTCIIPDGVTGIGDYAFAWSERLEKVAIPESVTHIGHSAFYSCENLKDIDLPNNVTEIGDYAFCGCDNLESVTIPDSVTKISNSAFQGCDNLKSVTIPDSVTEIGNDAFSWCNSMKSVTMPKNITRVGEDAFYGCNNLKTVKFQNQVPTEIFSFGYHPFPVQANIMVVPSETKTLSERLAEKLEKQSRANQSNKVALNQKAVVRIPESSIHALPNQPGMSYASIGLNSKHGTYGSIYFSDNALKTPRGDHNARLLYLNPDREYNVAFANPDTNQWEYHDMTGKEISDGNQAYLKERGLLKEVKRPLPSVADNMQAPQSDMQFE